MKESESFGSFVSSSHCNQIILGFLKIKKLKSVLIECVRKIISQTLQWNYFTFSHEFLYQMNVNISLAETTIEYAFHDVLPSSK